MIIKYTDFLSYFFYQKIAYKITLFLKDTKVTPNKITLLSLLIGVLASLFFLFDFKIISFFLLHLSFLFDCVDGQLARATNNFSKIGSFLDNISDRIVENFLLLVFVYKYDFFYIDFLIFFNMLFSYIQDILIYSKTEFLKLKKIEKVIFSPIYFLNRSFVILILSLSIYFASLLYLLLIAYIIGVIFYFYRMYKCLT
jgi:phosphatidylglycerophosphate synthase